MKKLICIFLVFVFCACDYVISIDGQVLSNTTNEPIVDAEVVLKVGRRRSVFTTTDSLGFFDVGLFGGGKFPRKYFVEINKEGYKNFKMEFRRGALKVKNESFFYDFGGTRFYPDSTNLSTWHGVSFSKYSTDFARRQGSFIIYLDVDDFDAEFKEFLKNFEKHKVE